MDDGRDTVVLTFPRMPKYYTVARLVLGGMAAPFQVPIDTIDDLQLALSTVLDRDDIQVVGDVVLRMEIDGESLSLTVGNIDTASLSETGIENATGEPDAFTLGHILGTLVDNLQVIEVGGHSEVSMTKYVGAAV